jgi:hypothetical protein
LRVCPGLVREWFSTEEMTAANPDPDGLARGRKLRDEAIDRVESNADEDWMKNGKRALWERLKQGGELTTDAMKDAEQPREGRAWGAVFGAARDAGFIRNTGRTAPSDQPQCHARPKTVWEVDEVAVQRAVNEMKARKR